MKRRAAQIACGVGVMVALVVCWRMCVHLPPQRILTPLELGKTSGTVDQRLVDDLKRDDGSHLEQALARNPDRLRDMVAVSAAVEVKEWQCLISSPCGEAPELDPGEFSKLPARHQVLNSLRVLQLGLRENVVSPGNAFGVLSAQLSLRDGVVQAQLLKTMRETRPNAKSALEIVDRLVLVDNGVPEWFRAFKTVDPDPSFREAYLERLSLLLGRDNYGQRLLIEALPDLELTEPELVRVLVPLCRFQQETSGDRWSVASYHAGLALKATGSRAALKDVCALPK